MSNVVNSDSYKQEWEKMQPLFVADNFKQEREYILSEKYKVITSEYVGNIGEYSYRGSDCTLLISNSKAATWQSIDNDADFYKVIKHNN